MTWTKYRIFLTVLLVVTGSINTLSTKWADELYSVNSAGDNIKFNHPFLQALAMFSGEILCLLTFKVLFRVYLARGDGSERTNSLTKGNTQFNPFILLIPAMCDMISTSIMYIGLNLTYASSFQMLRGSVIIFVGLLSVAFLNRTLKPVEWTGMILVMLGLTVVGTSDFITAEDGSHKANDIITGDLLIVIASIITSVQMVVEEKFVSGLDIPALQAVGWEGLFGFIVLGILQIPFYNLYVGPTFSKNPRQVLEDLFDGFIQLQNNYLLIIALIGTILSIAFFNFAGISVTKEISATTRMIFDSVRTVIIWLFSMAFMDQKFQWLQLVGFVVLLYGMFLYNGISLTAPCVRSYRSYLRIRNRNYGNLQEENVENYVADDPSGTREKENP